MNKKNIAVFGTGSDVGKSIVAAALCRYFADRGERVAPFKSQNMSNNSGITPEGMEMGRAQIVQAEAAGIAPHVDMNPILLKPTGEKKSQVVLNGLVHENQTAMDYHKNKRFYFKKACEAFDRISAKNDRIILEGAGSCAEVNLLDGDIVNFAMAEYADADVILVADIHRGGVFGQIVGTLECLPEKFKKRVKGLLINRFRGDICLFKDGSDWIEKKTGIKVLGVLPWYHHFRIDAEDSVEIETFNNFEMFDKNKPAIGVIRLPHIANFTDLHALSRIKDLQILFFDNAKHLSKFQAVILPGSKNTREDLEWLKPRFQSALENYCGSILGICGGYQMLGETVEDPDGLEGIPGASSGMGLLPVNTILKAPKTTTLSEFQWGSALGKGYEIHMGHTEVPVEHAFLNVLKRNATVCNGKDGCIINKGKIAGTYMHGFFDHSEIAEKWLHMVDIKGIDFGTSASPDKEKDYRLLKEHFEKHIDIQHLI